MVSQEETPHFALQEVLEVWILHNYCMATFTSLQPTSIRLTYNTHYIPSLAPDPLKYLSLVLNLTGISRTGTLA